MRTIDPFTTDTAVEWCDEMGDRLAAYITPLKIESDREWITWATHIMRVPQIVALRPPMPWLYNDWRQWASDFNVVLNYWEP